MVFLNDSDEHRQLARDAQDLADDLFGATIYSYTRAEAIEDGVLIDLNEQAPDVCAQHYKRPIACTAAVWNLIENAVANGADIPGTVHDLLWMSRVYVVGRPDESTVLFECALVTESGTQVSRFKMVCGPGDDCEPVLTLLMPNED